jgi:hypothetical protein
MHLRLARVSSVALFTICLIQAGIVGREYVWQWMGRTWRNLGKDAMQRNADFLLGARASRYMQFLSQTVPASGSVVLPHGVGEFSEQSILQFFLMPRTIPACPCGGSISADSADCAACLQAPGHTIPSIGAFPPQGILDEGGWRLVPYPEDTGWFHGLWLRAGYEGDVSIPQPNAFDPILAGLLDVIVYVALATLGAAVVVRVLHLEDWHSAAGLGLTLGGAWSLFWSSWGDGSGCPFAYGRSGLPGLSRWSQCSPSDVAAGTLCALRSELY